MQEVQSGWIARSGWRRRTKEIRNFSNERSRRRSASAESHGRINLSTRKDQVVDLHRQRIHESLYMDRRRKGCSDRQQRRIEEKICIGGESRQEQLIDEEGLRSGSSSARASTSTDGGRAVRNINSRGSSRRSASAERHGTITSSTKNDQGVNLHQ